MPADVRAETSPILSGGKPARAMRGGPSKGTAREAKELTVWTIKVATRALTHRGNLNIRFPPFVHLVLHATRPDRDCASGGAPRLGGIAPLTLGC